MRRRPKARRNLFVKNAGAVIIRMLELIEAGANVADVIFRQIV